LRLEASEVRVDAGVNIDARHPKYALSFNEEDPVYTYVTRLTFTGVVISPPDRAGDRYQIAVSGDEAPSRRVSPTLKQLQERDEFGSQKYRDYRGGSIPVYRKIPGLGLVDKARGEPMWYGCQRVGALGERHAFASPPWSPPVRGDRGAKGGAETVDRRRWAADDGSGRRLRAGKAVTATRRPEPEQTEGDAMDLPEDQHIYRYWIELRDMRDGSVRVLPLQAFRRIHLPTKKGSPQLPNEDVLQIHDGAVAIEARDIDDLAARLRQKYPDVAFERFLRCERD
jgi:hypothetical protein